MTNYVPIAGCVGRWTAAVTPGFTSEFYSRREGVFIDDLEATFSSVTDGLSNTLFFSEYVGQLGTGGTSAPAAQTGEHSFSLPWFAANGFPTYWSQQNPQTLFSLGSRHTGVFNVCYGDGSVRVLRNLNRTAYPPSAAWITGRQDAAWDTLQSLSGRGEGDVASDVIGN